MFRRLEILLILVALAVTLGLFISTKRSIERTEANEFRIVTEGGLHDLINRMNLYMQSLNSAASFIRASDDVSYDDFDRFVETLEIESNLPGISGIGLIVPVAAADVPVFLEESAENGRPDFTIHPQTDSAEKFVTKYIFPVDGNEEAIGLDTSFEEGRRAAAIRARESGEPQMTPLIKLVQGDTRQPGFLLLRPVYDIAVDGAGRGEFRSWVYAAIVGANLMSNLTKAERSPYTLTVYDGAAVTEDTIIFRGDKSDARVGEHVAHYTVPLYGQVWTVHFESTAAFDTYYNDRSAYMVLVGGLLLTLMLAYLLRNMRLRSKALSQVAELRRRQIDVREEEYRSIIENSVTAMLTLDAAGRVISANQAAAQTFGYPVEAMRGRAFEEFVNTSADIQLPIHHNATGRTRTGETLVLDIQRNGWQTLDGISRTTAIIRDVTAETQAVKEMKAVKERFDLAVEGSEIGIFEVEIATRKSIVSPTWCKIMGIDADPATIDSNKQFRERLHPDDFQKVRAATKSLYTGQADRMIVEYRILFGKDEWRWMRSDAAIVEWDDKGRSLRMVGTQSDVTDLHQARNALENSEARFRMVLADAPVGMALMTDIGELTVVNEAMCHLGGYQHKELLKGRIQDLIPAKDMKIIYAAVSGMIASGTSETYQGQHRVIRKDGTERWGLVNISWGYDKNAGSNYFIIQINDITDQKHLDQLKSEFVSTVSHELRTPLTSIKGALGLVKVSAEQHLPAAGQRLIQIATSNVDRLTAIVNDILDLEKISSGDVEFNIEDIDLGEIIEASQAEMSPFAMTHKNTLRVELSEEVLIVKADWLRIMQVLANLTSNACKYSFADTEVLIKTERINDLAIVYIQNSGPGVPDSFKGKIFQAFSQADSSDTRAKGGTGLGLNITRQIMLRHDGEVGFKSIANGLTVFWFTLPLADAKTMEELPVPSKPQAGLDDRKIHVLHLEDDTDFAEVIRTGLAPYAHVCTVGSIAAAENVIGKKEVDIVLIDWRLSDGDASVLLDKIELHYPRAKIVSLSADGHSRQDPRVHKSLVKSRTGLSAILEAITVSLARAS